MKNLISLVSLCDTRDFVSKLWKSDLFRESHYNGGYVWERVKRFAWLPRVFAESSNDHLERAHFSTWWNVIMLRPDYENPIIHDLYYLHEMTHAATMPYIAGIGREAFEDKMQRNELEASVLSEVGVYLEMPGLREASFDHEIYADRFLNNSIISDLWKLNRDVAIETIRSMRRNVMVSKNERDMDRTELWIRRFADQNAIYGTVWADRYADIEATMAKMQSLVSTDGRDVAAKSHLDWIKKEAALDPIDNIPFRAEAELFAPFYWSNKEKYTKAMA